jgi:hypothetical protein
MAGFTPTQGRYLAFISAYTNLHGCPPAESEIATALCVSPPSVTRCASKANGPARRKMWAAFRTESDPILAQSDHGEEVTAARARRGRFQFFFAGPTPLGLRFVSRSTISLPLPSLLASLKSGNSDSWFASSRGLRIFLLIWSPMSGLPLRATRSAKEEPAGTLMEANGCPAYLC